MFLDRIVFPLNYQILNLIGFGLAQMSTFLVGKVVFPEPSTAPAQSAAPAGQNRLLPALPRWSSLVGFLREQRAFVNFNITTLVCWVGAWGAVPLYTIYFVRELQFSNGWLGIAATLSQLAVMLSAPLWNRVILRRSNLWVLLRTVLLTGCYPCLVVLFPAGAPILAFSFLNTLNDTAINISHTAIFLDVIPPEKRHSYIAGHTALMNVGAMAAPLITAPLSARSACPSCC